MTSKSKRKPAKAKSTPNRLELKRPQKHHATPAKVPKAAMKRQAKAADPQQSPRVVFMPVASQGLRVTEDKALTYSVVWACVKVIAETIGSLSWHVLEEKENGDNERVKMSPVEWLLNKQANEEMSAGTFRETLIGHALIWGNGYAEIERDGAGRPYWLWPLAPDRMEVDRDELGRLVYIYHPQSGPEVPYSAREIFHLKGIGFDGLVGYPVAKLAGQSFGLGLEMERSGATHFANDARPSGVLKYPGKTTPDILNETEKRWKSVYGGRHKNGVVAMDQGLDYQAIAASMVDSQWNEARQAQIEEGCRWFRVQPHKIMHLLRSTNNNIEHQSIEFVQDTILPWAKRLEQEADIKLFGQQRQGRFFTKLNLASLLRGDSQAQAFLIQTLADRGVYSVNQILKLLDMNGIGPDGDKRFVQSNMIPLDMAGQQFVQPEPAKPTAAADEPEDEETNGNTNMHTNRLNGHEVN